MGILDDIKNTQAPARCMVASAFESMSPEDANDLRVGLDDPAIWHSTISTVMAKRGLPLSSHVISKHRRRECSCYRGET